MPSFNELELAAIERDFSKYCNLMQRNVPYAELGFWKIGGPIELLMCPGYENVDGVVQKIRRTGIPVTVLGNGSNMLVADAGVSGVGLSLEHACSEILFDIENDNPGVIVGAGVSNSKLLSKCRKHKMAGLSALAGVPGRIGGAIRMNAGTVLGEIGDSVDWVEWIDNSGALHRSPAEDLQFGYRRSSGLPWSAIIMRARFVLRKDPGERERVMALIKRRKNTQPLNLPSCGSVFKNPEGDFAGRLIENVGLKGLRNGDAQISDVHANFIVNHGNASASSVVYLMQQVISRVFEEHGVQLSPEVRPEGDWPASQWPLSVQ